jgi:hypothetical protein
MEDPTIERGITRQGHVVCFGHIDRPTEGLRCCNGGHWRSRRAISEDGRSIGQLPWSGSHGLWSIGPCDEDRSPLARHGSPCTRGHGMHPTRALSPCPTIGKEHRSVMPTRPTTGILTPRKVTIQCQLMVPSSSSDDDLPLVKHDAQVDLNPGGTRICYTQEPALVLDSPPSSPLLYTMLGQWVGVGRSKVLIPNPEYKGKGLIESASSNPTPRVQ